MMDRNAQYLREFSAALRDFGIDTEQKATLVLREAYETTAEAIVIGNEFGPGAPIETGFLRSSFRVSLNVPDDSGGSSGEPGATYATNLDLTPIASAELGDTLHVSTPAEYAVYLETLPLTRQGGEHKGQPTPFVAPVEARFSRIVEDAAQRVGYGDG